MEEGGKEGWVGEKATGTDLAQHRPYLFQRELAPAWWYSAGVRVRGGGIKRDIYYLQWVVKGDPSILLAPGGSPIATCP